MKRFDPPPEPPDFDDKVRQPGKAWLAKNLDQNGKLPQGKRPPDRWCNFKMKLAEGFGGLCAYLVMYMTGGEVDHYLSCKNYPKQAYEWRNYRYVSGWINKSKGTLDDTVLDPFQVEDDWFEILLPSLQLVVTKAVPAAERERAEFTLTRLHLGHSERIIRLRQKWYEMYQQGDLALEGLKKVAPLIARAVIKQKYEKSN